MRSFLFFLAFLSISQAALAKLNILATTNDLGVLARELGGSEVEITVLCPPDRDPHYLEPKPSYMIKASKADLVLSIGLELEIGWLPPVLRGGRNPKVMPGAPGYCEAQSFIQPLELGGGASRAQGDVHPGGNPHFMLDPVRDSQIALGLAEKLAELDPAHAADYRSRAQAFKKRMEEKTAAWQKRIKASGTKEAFTYHKTLVYFFDRFGLENAGNLEPKPGIPPTASHLLELMRVAKDRKVRLTLVEHYFDLGAAKKIATEVPGMRVALAPVMPGAPQAGANLDDLFESLVSQVEGKP
ncbi:MAG: metal ABC transporter substrate-binding protein [candidate division FCPU426 bacterium]